MRLAAVIAVAPMPTSEQTVRRLYDALAALDADTMATCYAEPACFEDEVFSLRGREEIAAMWQMLVTAALGQPREAWRLDYRDIRIQGHTGSAHWDAHYRFSATGRAVVNRIDSHFCFDADGLILTQRDRFDFWRWSRQALGAPGLLLGWSPWLRAKVRAQAAQSLRRHRQRTTASVAPH